MTCLCENTYSKKEKLDVDQPLKKIRCSPIDLDFFPLFQLNRSVKRTTQQGQTDSKSIGRGDSKIKQDDSTQYCEDLFDIGYTTTISSLYVMETGNA